MIIYLIKSGSCLALLLGFYLLFLEKEKMHQFNRFYLLGSILVSFIAPSIIIYTEAPQIIQPIITFQNEFEPLVSTTITRSIETETTATKQIDYSYYLLICYLIISLILFIRFCKNLFYLGSKIRTNEKISYKNSTLILIDEVQIPHTFLNYIFINKEDYYSDKIKDEIFTHELTHVTQKHTLDIILIELFQIICWINPLLILLKKAIKLNHEFIADQCVVLRHQNSFEYQNILLNTITAKNSYLASNFNYSNTKKRLIMITKKSSYQKILFKRLAIIPLVILLTLLIAKRVEAQENNDLSNDKNTTVPQIKQSDSTELYKEYFYKNAKFKLLNEKGKTIRKNYFELTKKEKENIPPPLPLEIETEKKVPNPEQMAEWKDPKIYGLWIDNTKVSNSMLNHYKNSDFSNYYISILHKKKTDYGKYKYDLSLYTNKYFENQYQKSKTEFEAYKENPKSFQDKIEPLNPPSEKKESYSLSLVKYAPTYNGCEESNSQFEIRKCLSESFINHIKNNLNQNLIKTKLGSSTKNNIGVLFNIDKTGDISSIYWYTRSDVHNDEIIDKEIKRVFDLIPTLTPGIRKGKPVIVKYSLNISITDDNIINIKTYN